MPAIFLLPVCFTYWPRKYTTRVDPTIIIPTKFEVCRVIAFLSDDTWRYLDLWPLTFWPWTVDMDRGHVSNLATKFQDPVPIHSWVMSYNVFRWIPLKMRTRPLRMRRITWPVSRGSKTITFSECPTQICLFTIQFLLFRARFGDISRLQAEL